MKSVILAFAICLSIPVFSQKHVALPHGTVFGSKPNAAAMLAAANLEPYMGNKTRISTTISGRVLKVTKTKGGWFEIDGGKGKVIAAHFRDYNVSIPLDLKGKYVIAEGVAAKEFIADDMQHLAGDTVTGEKQHNVKTNPKKRLTFEAKGLMVDH